MEDFALCKSAFSCSNLSLPLLKIVISLLVYIGIPHKECANLIICLFVSEISMSLKLSCLL